MSFKPLCLSSTFAFIRGVRQVGIPWLQEEEIKWLEGGGEGGGRGGWQKRGRDGG